MEPGAKVEQFDNICEVQSDKASVEVCTTTALDNLALALEDKMDQGKKTNRRPTG